MRGEAIYHTLDICPHCWKPNAVFRLASQDRLQPNGGHYNIFSSASYGALWICQSCFKSLGVSIFVVL